MKRTLIKELSQNLDKEVLLKGWVQDLRNLSKIKFLILRDRTGDMQTIALKGTTEEASFASLDGVTNESVVEIVGIPKKNKESRWGMEVVIKRIELVSCPSG